MANRSLTPVVGLAGLLALLTLAPEAAAAQCQLCDASAETAAANTPAKPLRIEIETRMDFAFIGRLGSGATGAATIDPVTGQRTLTGGVIDLGGMPVQGTVTIRGEAKEHVQVDLPVQVTLYNSAGATLEMDGFTSTLKNNPKLGDDGVLRFNFGARLKVTGQAMGNFRGSIPITVEYR